MNEMYKINFSVLKYMPSSVRRETINVGIVFHLPSQSKSFFYSLKNNRRVSSFDDEYDKDFYQMMMKSIHYEFDYPKKEQELFKDFLEESFNDITNDIFLVNKTRNYINEFIFTTPDSILSNENELETDIDNLKKTYLYYDRPKNERITTAEVKKLLSKQVKLSSIRLKEQVSDIADSINSDEKVFDYKIDNTYIKAVSFDYARKKNVNTEMKVSLFDLMESFKNDKVKKVKIVTNDTIEEQEDYFRKYKSLVNEYSEGKNIKVEYVKLSDFSSSFG